MSELPRIVWRPRPSWRGFVSGLAFGVGAMVLLQQAAVLFPDPSFIAAVIVASVAIGQVLANLGRRAGVRKLNNRISALEPLPEGAAPYVEPRHSVTSVEPDGLVGAPDRTTPRATEPLRSASTATPTPTATPMPSRNADADTPSATARVPEQAPRPQPQQQPVAEARTETPVTPVEPAPAIVVPPRPAEWRRTHVAPPAGLHAYEKPDPSLAPSVYLAAGTELRVVEEAGAWSRVDASNTWTGWVDGRLLEPKP